MKIRERSASNDCADTIVTALISSIGKEEVEIATLPSAGRAYLVKINISEGSWEKN